MIGVLVSIGLAFVCTLLYCCVRVGAEADERMKDWFSGKDGGD